MARIIKNNLRVYYENVDNYDNDKYNEIQVILTFKTYDIIALTSTQPTPQTSTILHINGYRLYQNRRSSKYDTGIIVYVRKAFKVSILRTHVDGVESFWLEIFHGAKVMLCVVNSEYDNITMKNLIEKFHSHNYQYKILIGKFFPWNSNNIKSSPLNRSIYDCNLKQFICHPTFRHIINCLIIGNLNSVNNIKLGPGLSVNEFSSISFSITGTSVFMSGRKKEYIYEEGDYASMREELTADKSFLLRLQSCEDIDVTYNLFCEKIVSLIDKHVPYDLNTNKSDDLKWISNDVTQLVRQKQYMYNSKYYLRHCRHVIDAINEAHDHYNETMDSINDYIREQGHKNQSVVSELYHNGKLITRYREIANVLSEYFYQSFTEEKHENVPLFEPIAEVQLLDHLEITDEHVEEQIQNLKFKAVGIDQMRPYVIKELGKAVVPHLKVIFQKSLDLQKLPQKWKNARIMSKLKQGDPKDPANYRPISITSVVCKMLERVIKAIIDQHLDFHDLQSRWQHGHKNGRSNISNLLESTHTWVDYLSHNIPVDVIFLDIKKAFDSVPHRRLILKLKQYGITGNVLGWIRDFLTNRMQRVTVHGHNSDWKRVISGVAQGTVLGTILFILYVNDIPGLVRSRISMYTDDIKLCAPVNNSQANTLQDDLDKLQVWSKHMQLRFNPSKCKVMHFGTDNPNRVYNFTDSENHVFQIENVQSHKDLGVIMDVDLTFSEQITENIGKARDAMLAIMPIFNRMTPRVFKGIYDSIVRRKLMNAAPVWHVVHKYDEDQLERFQEWATTKV